MFRIPLADAVIAVALATGIAVTLTVTHPALTNDSFVFTLGKVSQASAAALPPSTLPAKVLSYQGQNRRQHRIVLESPVDGLFTLSGAAFNSPTGVRAMRLWINGDPITFGMLESGVSDEKAPMPLRPIAHNARLRVGENELIIRTPETHLPIILRLERQAPTPWWKPVGAAVAALAILLPLAAFGNQSLSTGFRRPVAALAVTLLFLAATLVWIAADSGAELVHAGNTPPDMDSRMAELDEGITAADKAAAGVVRVATVGDSTHQSFGIDFDDALKKALDRDRPGEYAVFGFSHGGMSGRDFYLLFNKLLAHHPDVVVMPINVLTFEDRWYNNRMWHFSMLDRYLRFDEFPRAFGLRVGQRRFRWERVLLHRADAAWLDQRGNRFITGLRFHVTHTLDRWDYVANEALDKRLPDPAAIPIANSRIRTVVIPPDGDIVKVFRAINDLARRHNVRVVYYTTPLRTDTQDPKGIHYQTDLNFDMIQKALTGPSDITFLRLDENFPLNLFRDDLVHLTETGIQSLANQVAREIETLDTNPPSTP